MNTIAGSRSGHVRKYLTDDDVIAPSWEAYLDRAATIGSYRIGTPTRIYWSASRPVYHAAFDLPFLRAAHRWVQPSNIYLHGSNLYDEPITQMEHADVTVNADYFGDAEWFTPVLAQLQTVMNVDPADRESTNPVYAIQALAFFAVALMPATAPPSFSPLNDGGLQAEWHRGGLDVEVVFSPEAAESGIFVRDKETGEEDEIPLDAAAFREAVGDRLRNHD